MNDSPLALAIVHEDDHILVLNKPAGLATMGVPDDQPSLLTQTKRYLSSSSGSQCPFVAVISRLDFPVSGIVIVAKDPVSANHMHLQFSERRPRKDYHALVCPLTSPPEADLPAEAELTDWIVKSKRHRKVHVLDEGSDEVQLQKAQQAKLRYKTLRQTGSYVLLEVQLLTGRKHQIRAQLAAHGFPVLGDFKYKSPEQFPLGIALLSKRLELTHPATEKVVAWEVDYPDYWPAGE